MSDKHHGNPVATYIITALILGVITYIEFAIVEYEIAWLSQAATLFWLFALSIIKFVMVVAIFMHLKDDERTYTGFFGSGMLIALATFLILPLLFTVSSFPGQPAVGAPIEPHPAVDDDLDAETRELIETDGYSRSADRLLGTPRPLDRSLAVEAPAAAEPQAALRQGQAADEEAADEADVEEPAVQEAAAEADAEAERQDEAAAEEQPEQQPAVEFDRELGESIYAQNCASCHQAGGAGVPGAFPPLAGTLPPVFQAEDGQEYLIDVVLYGLTGEIEVAGQTYNGFMPAWGDTLSNEEVAAVLNHELTAWENEAAFDEFVPITPQEVEARRGQDPGDLAERRSQLQIQ